MNLNALLLSDLAAWALMLTGFLGAGATLRRRREQKAIAAA